MSAAESSNGSGPSPTRRGINIFAKKGSPVVAVNDGVVRKLGHSAKLGNFFVLEDTYGNRYTYAGLGKLVLRQIPAKPARTIISFGKEIKVSAKPKSQKLVFRFSKDAKAKFAK